jgi:signal transduction histidine kinase
MAIAKAIEAHGGGIALRSKPRLGTTIEVSLPILPQLLVA